MCAVADKSCYPICCMHLFSGVVAHDHKALSRCDRSGWNGGLGNILLSNAQQTLGLATKQIMNIYPSFY